MIVIDVGSATHGGDQSVTPLIERYNPKQLWGFDPATQDRSYQMASTLVTERQAALWTYTGYVNFKVAGLGGQVDEKGAQTRCFDICGVVAGAHALDEDVVLKLDCEAAEYELLPRLHEHGLDVCLKLALVEWHCEVCRMGIWNQDLHRDECPSDKQAWIKRRDDMIELMRCPVEGWSL